MKKEESAQLLTRKSISQPSYRELIYFKEEVYQSLKEFEKKIQEKTNFSLNNFEEIIKKEEKNIENFENKINLFINKTEIEEKKIEIKEEINKKIESFKEEIALINIQISALRKDINNSCYKYDKIIIDNLIIKGLIGDGCKFKNLKEYLLFEKEEYNKIERLNQKVLLEFKFFKTKIENIIKEFNIQLETLKNSFGEYIKIQIKEYDKNQQIIINDIYDKIAKNTLYVEQIKPEIDNIKKYCSEVKKIKEEIIEIKNDILQKMDSTVEKTKKMDLTVLNELNEVKKEFKNIKKSIAGIGELLIENINNEDDNDNKREIIRGEIISNFNNTVINLMKNLKNEKHLNYVSKKSVKIGNKENIKNNKSLIKMKSMVIPSINQRKASEINLLFPMNFNNSKVIDEKANDSSKNSNSMKKSHISNINNTMSNNQIEILSYNQENNHSHQKNLKIFKNSLLKKSMQKSCEEKNVNLLEKTNKSNRSFNSEDEEIISSKTNLNFEENKSKIIKNELKNESQKNLNNSLKEDKLFRIESNYIKLDVPKKKSKKVISESNNYSSPVNINKNINIITNNNSTDNNNEINNKIKTEKKVIFRNRIENKRDHPFKVLSLNDIHSPHNSFNNNNSNYLSYQQLNIKNKENENPNSIYKNQIMVTSNDSQNKLSNFELVSENDIVDIPLTKKNNLEIEKNNNKLENKIIELEFFTKKKFDELVKEIKNFIPIHFNSYIKDYSVIESNYKKNHKVRLHSTSLHTNNKNVFYLPKKFNSNKSLDNNENYLKTTINFHKKDKNQI